MWQRAQTFYIFVATVLVATLFFCDKAEDMTYMSYLPYAVLTVIITLLNIIAFTTFRFRVFQVRTVVLSALLTLALQGWLAVDFFVTGNNPPFHLSAVFPIAAVILDVLAARGIWADELMVRSASRLRGSRKKRG